MSDATVAEAEAPALPGDGLREQIVDQVRSEIGDALVDSLVKPGDDLWLRVRTDAWREAGFALRDLVGCDYICFLSGLDWLPSPFGKVMRNRTNNSMSRAIWALVVRTRPLGPMAEAGRPSLMLTASIFPWYGATCHAAGLGPN